MKLAQINEWFSLVANLGVVVGIIFLVIEISQNTAQLEADARSYRASEVIELQLFTAEHDDMFSTDECTPRENQWTLALFELQMWQYLETGLEDYLVARYQDYAEGNPCFVERWHEVKHRYNPEFASFMDENVYNL